MVSRWGSWKPILTHTLSSAVPRASPQNRAPFRLSGEPTCIANSHIPSRKDGEVISGGFEAKATTGILRTLPRSGTVLQEVSYGIGTPQFVLVESQPATHSIAAIYDSSKDQQAVSLKGRVVILGPQCGSSLLPNRFLEPRTVSSSSLNPGDLTRSFSMRVQEKWGYH